MVLRGKCQLANGKREQSILLIFDEDMMIFEADSASYVAFPADLICED